MRERHNTTIAVFGGKPGENVEYKGRWMFHTYTVFRSSFENLRFLGMAGNQVIQWRDIDTEIKSANLKDVSPINNTSSSIAPVLIWPYDKDPLAPPDLWVIFSYTLSVRKYIVSNVVNIKLGEWWLPVREIFLLKIREIMIFLKFDL